MARARLVGALLLALSLAPTVIVAVKPEGPALGFFADPLRGLWSYLSYNPVPSGSERVPGLPGGAVVAFDGRGVPHVFASDERSAYYAFGYVQACSRLWQMDILRRLAEGRLSELLGEKAYSLDVYMRSLGLHLAAQRSLEAIRSLADQGDPAALATLDALELYSRGVNACIERLVESGRLPLEYRVLGARPAAWRPVDSLAVAKLLDYMLAFSIDDLYWALLAWASNGTVLALHQDYVEWLASQGREIIHEPTEALRAGERLGLPAEMAYAPNGLRPVDPSTARILNTTMDLGGVIEALQGQARLHATVKARVLAAAGFTGFSNNWVVAGGHTISGLPLLANDPHLQLTAPPVWFEARLYSPDGLDVYGVTLPGLPFILIGRTRSVAFGHTNSFIDVTDFYYYKWRSGRYLYNGDWLEPRWRSERILVRRPDGSLEARVVRVAETVHGPLVEFNVSSSGGYAVAVRSTALMPSTSAVWAYLVNHARSVEDVARAQRYFQGPIQNTVAADTSGNIAYLPVGLVPVRTSLPLVRVAAPEGSRVIVNTGFLPFNGSRGEGEWAGYIHFNMLPRLLNPSGGLVVTANNMIARGFMGNASFYLQWGFMDSYRWLRIEELLRGMLARGKRLGLADMEAVQTDTVSEPAKRVLPLVEKLLGGGSQLLAALHGWLEEPVMDAGRYEPSIAFALLRSLHHLAWGRVAEKAGLNLDDLDVSGHVARLEYVEYMLSTERGRWYLERLTGMEPEELAERAVVEAARELEEFYGHSRVEGWVWGRAHQLLCRHVLGEVLPWLNYGPTPVNGGPFTVNVAPITRLGGRVEAGPSVRFLADLASDTGAIVLPGGEWGWPLSPHYRDQLQAWLQGVYYEYRLTSSSREVSGPVLSLERR